MNPLTNQPSAYVVKVRKDSVSDTIGRLQVGDEIVKWNGKLLRGLAYDEVYAIMTKTKQENQIELVAERLNEYFNSFFIWFFFLFLLNYLLRI